MIDQRIPPEVLGERLRLARSAAGMTQDAAANAIGIARTTLVAIERGQRRVRSEELLALAANYRISVGKLVASEAVHVDLNAKFRKLDGRTQSASVVGAIDLLNRLASGAVELERALGVELRSDYPPPIKILTGRYYDQAEDAAIGLRNRLGIGLGKISDLMSVLELDLGVRVFCRPLPNGSISGLYAFDSSIGACILVNASHPWRRRMQTLAHETGHFITDRSYADVMDEESVALTLEEKFARRFGGALLMPAPALRARFEQLLNEGSTIDVRALVLLAHQFNVVPEAMCRRLEELELLARGTWASIRERGYNSSLESEVIGDIEHHPSPPAIPPRLAFLAARALTEDVLSEGQLCEMLVVERVELWRTLAPFLSDGAARGE